MTRMRTAVPATLLPYAAALQFWVLLNWNSSLAAWSCCQGKVVRSISLR